MKILLIADPHIPVPPSHYGGAERIVALYAEEFARLGHHVHLMAGDGSLSFGGRLHLHKAPSLNHSSRAYRKLRFQLQSLLAARDCDVVYNFGRVDYLRALLATDIPVLHCFQNPATQPEVDFIECHRKSRTAFHFVSSSQRSAVSTNLPNCVLPNCIDSHKISVGTGQGSYLAFLGRLTRNKGVDVAISVAKLTGYRLMIAGNISTEEGGETFFRDEVKPHLDGKQICWIGPVDDLQKKSFLGSAKAVLFPIRWEDPCPIVLFESLACGCPVIATNRASVPEVIEHRLTGFLCDPAEPSAEVFAEAVAQLEQLDRQACRRAAEERFDIRVLAPRVLDVLNRLAEGSPLL